MRRDVADTSNLSTKEHVSKGGGGTMISTPCGMRGFCLIGRLLVAVDRIAMWEESRQRLAGREAGERRERIGGDREEPHF